MKTNEAAEQSFQELGLSLDDISDDILTETVDNAEPEEAEDGPAGDEVAEEPVSEEDTEEDAEVADTSGEAVVELPSGGKVRLPDGTEVDVDKAVLLQSDYTKKTQQLAEERKQFENERAQITDAYEKMRDWYEQRSSNPSDWVREIVEGAGDPTATIAKALYELANNGKLDPEFVKAFGIDAAEVQQRAAKSDKDREVEELRKRLDQREATEAEQAAIRQQAAQYQAQWDEIKNTNGLNFDSGESEVEAKRELLNFALQNRLSHSLVDAYDLMQFRRSRTVQPQAEQAPKPDPQVTEKKRASRAVTPKSAGGSGQERRKPISTRDAALQVLEDYARA